MNEHDYHDVEMLLNEIKPEADQSFYLLLRHQLINDLPLGRSIDEAIRILDSLIFFEKNGEVCPANWHQGEKSMKPNQEGLKEYFHKN